MSKIFTVIIFLGLLSVIMPGCSNDNDAISNVPEYDRTYANKLLEACNAMAQNQTDTALNALEQISKDFPDDRFATNALDQENTRNLINQANELLSNLKQQEQALNTLIRENEFDCPELRQFTKYRDALNALSEVVDNFAKNKKSLNADSLGDNLRQLEPFLDILNQSPAFREYYSKLNARYSSMLAHDKQLALQEAVQEADRAIIAGIDVPQFGKLNEYMKQFPLNNPFEKIKAFKNAKQWTDILTSADSSDYHKEIAEILALKQWNLLDSSTKNAILSILSKRQPLTLSGLWLSVQNGIQVQENLEQLLDRLAVLKTPIVPRQDIIEAILTKCVLPAAHYNAWCWRSPCPGAPEWLARIYQVMQRKR